MIIDARVRLPADLRSDMAERPDDLTEGYDAVLDISARAAYGRTELDTAMKTGGVDRALVHAEYEHGDYADELNQGVADMVASAPERYLGVGTVSQELPLDIMRAVGQVAACAELGFVGVSLQPAFFHMAIDDRRLYPVYAKTAEADLVAFVHTGINYGTTHPFGNDHPMLLDQIAWKLPFRLHARMRLGRILAPPVARAAAARRPATHSRQAYPRAEASYPLKS